MESSKGVQEMNQEREIHIDIQKMSTPARAKKKNPKH